MSRCPGDQTGVHLVGVTLWKSSSPRVGKRKYADETTRNASLSGGAGFGLPLTGHRQGTAVRLNELQANEERLPQKDGGEGSLVTALAPPLCASYHHP